MHSKQCFQTHSKFVDNHEIKGELFYLIQTNPSFRVFIKFKFETKLIYNNSL
jgi:hypothetical protein